MPRAGQKQTEEAKRKISESRKRDWALWPDGPYGNRPPISDEHKAKLSEALKGRSRPEETKRKIGEGVRKAWAKRRAEAESYSAIEEDDE